MPATTEKQLIRLGHSPDPDDAFMFFALAHHRIDTGNLQFQDVLQDIETLNRWAEEGRLEVTALSVHAYAHVEDRYLLLPHGASVGERYGPLLVGLPGTSLREVERGLVAIPGRRTTAYLALKLAMPAAEVIEVPFDRIPEAVLQGQATAGLLIHEGQLTYERLGLHKILDLGEWWHQETGLPLPLGVNAARRDLGLETIRRISRLLLASIRYGLEHRQEALDYALGFGRGLERALADRFVGMYVNDFTLDIGPQGRKGMEELLRRGHRAGLLPQAVSPEFVA